MVVVMTVGESDCPGTEPPLMARESQHQRAIHHIVYQVQDNACYGLLRIIYHVRGGEKCTHGYTRQR